MEVEKILTMASNGGDKQKVCDDLYAAIKHGKLGEARRLIPIARNCGAINLYVRYGDAVYRWHAWKHSVVVGNTA